MSFDSRETSRYDGQPYELYLFSTEDAEYRFTGEDTARTAQGEVWTPAIITHSGTNQSTEVSGGHITVTIPRDHVIALMFVSFIPSTPLYLTMLRGHDGDSQIVVIFTGRVQSCKFAADDTCELDCAPESELLKREIATSLFQRPCNRVLFDAGCGADKETYKKSGTVASVSADGLTVTAAVFSSMANGWFTTGYIERGAHKRMIVAHTGNTATLMNAMPGLAAGAEINAYPGCDRTHNGCVQKFGNGANFFGYQWMPDKNPFASGME